MGSADNRPRAMFWSGAAHIVAIGLMCVYPASYPNLPPVPPPAARITLTAPPKPLQLPPRPKPKAAPQARLTVPEAQQPRPETPAIEAPRLQLDSQPAVALPLNQPKLDQPEFEAPAPKAAPALTAATASAPRPRTAKVRAAGFDGAPVQAKGPTAAARLEVGSFQGLTGTPGGSQAAGRQAEVRQGGFAATITARADGKPGPGVGAGGFGGVVAAGGGRAKAAPTGAAGFEQVRGEKAEARREQPERPVDDPRTTPVQILSKPRPVYTAEARERRIEGEVVLQVRFGADGRLQVLRVARGLGHGLDEAAVEAVEAMAFRPALRNGNPVDAALSVSVAFRLAY